MKSKKIFRFRSLMALSTLLLAVLFVVVISAQTWISYTEQKSLFKERFMGLGSVLETQLDTNLSQVKQIAQAVAKHEPSDTEPFQVIRRQLKAMLDNGQGIGNAYILTTGKMERNGSRAVINLQGPDDQKLQPGSEYQMPAYFENAFDQTLKEGSAVTVPYDDDLGTWVTYLSAVTDEQGNIISVFGIDFDYDGIQKRLSEILWTSLAVGAAFLVAAIIIVSVAVRYALKPLRRLADVSQMAAAGDLTVSVPVRSNNEIGQAANAFNVMVSSLRELAGNVQRTALEVTDEAKLMQESSQQTAQATNEITEAISQVAADSETQLQSSTECQRAMSEMSVGIQRIAESSSVVSDLAANTTERAVEGESVMKKSLEQMQTIENNLSDSVGTMRELEELSRQIGGILALIADVANQTNLLALNASIEAARAGEHGRGFAVVAQQIRKLAEQSRNSSEQVKEILEGIGDRTNDAVTSLQRSSDEARMGTQIALQAGDSFRAIVLAIREVSAQVQEVSAASEQMSAGSEEIAASMEELERITSSSAMHTQRVAASSEEQLASMEEIASSSEQLLTMARNLSQIISKFRV
ncbi:methyl-accepting chemotaxis protein [Paenibacillus sp. XY044]|uniref:methyl-accepting chemotaxis protein n=1 Tax=Paenibacillus sp. XY044 TaxID=2026089 RepID=UPI0015C5F50E|nr:methyl-accepting chemotaxis protein [Paenibacillus sp. XY044]